MSAKIKMLYVIFVTLLFGDSVNGINVADQFGARATCSATVDPAQGSVDSCRQAIDGINNTQDPRYYWNYTSMQSAVGIEFNITFNQTYTLYSAQFMQLYNANNQNFRKLQLRFDDENTQEVILTAGYQGLIWDNYILTPPVSTRNVYITVIDVQPANGSTSNGFTEVAFYNDNSTITSTNVALVTLGATCKTSLITDTPANCSKALDGVSSSGNTAFSWSFHHVTSSNIGLQFNVTFQQSYTIYSARFMQLFHAEETNFKKLQLRFDDRATQEVTLTANVSGFIWDTYTLEPPVSTQNVYITVLEEQPGAYSGFIEIEFHNYPNLSTISTTLTTTTSVTTALPTTTVFAITTQPTTTTTQPTTITTQPTTTPTQPTTTQPTTSTTQSTTTTTQPTTTQPTTSTTQSTTTTTQPTTTQLTTSTTQSTSTTTQPTTTTTTQPAMTTPQITTTNKQPSTTTTTVLAATVTVTSTISSTTTVPTISSSVQGTNTTDAGNFTTLQSTISTPSLTTTGLSMASGITRNQLITYVIISCIGALVIGLFCLLFVYFCCRGGKSKKMDKDPERIVLNGTASRPRPESLDYAHVNYVLDDNANQYKEMDEVDNIPTRPIPIPKLGEVIMKLGEDDGFGEEFREIPSGETDSITKAKQKNNLKKNRFNNIFPFDQNRVILSQIDDIEDTDYINASYMHGYNNDKAFIAAQGPNDWTVPDFWRLVWEKDCPIIVMVTNLVEKERTKCSQYWPEEEVTHGLLNIQLIEENTGPQFMTRHFEITRGEQKKQVNQYHFTVWPDEGVPDTGTDVLSLLKKVNQEDIRDRGPILVHCSAGVGRTGTFIALDYLQRQAEAEGVVDIFKCIHLLRNDRMNTIQSLAQYRFIYLTLLEALECQFVSTPVDEFPMILPKIQDKQDGAEVSVIEKQFQILEVYKARKWRETCTEALQEGNADKNRDINVVPSEIARPTLTPVAGRTNYICASFAKGYKKPYAHLVTQMPLPNTVPELWRLVMNFQVQAIVMLNTLEEEKPYWPKNEESMDIIDLFTLEKLRVHENDITITDLRIAYKEDETDDMMVKLFQTGDWPSEEKFPPERSLLDLYHKVAEWIRKNDDSKMLVHCLNGCERSGLLLATHFIVEKINHEQEVDVFNAVKQIRQLQPQFIPSLEQYQYLYSIGKTYLDSFHTYANMKSVQFRDEVDYVDVILPGIVEEEEDSDEEPEETNQKVEEQEDDEEEDTASIHHLIIEVD